MLWRLLASRKNDINIDMLYDFKVMNLNMRSLCKSYVNFDSYENIPILSRVITMQRRN